MPIFQRTVKLVLATCLAIFIADRLNLAYTSSAGIIAILSILDTRRSSLKMAGQRLLSTLLALTVSSLLFSLFGYSIPVLGLYLAIYVPLAYYWQIEAGIAPSTVLVSHLLLEESISLFWLTNEVAIFIIGTGIALFFNLYMPSRNKEIATYHERVEQALKQILLRFNRFLLAGDGTNDARLIRELDALLDQALETVYLERYNQVFNQTNYQVHYFEMRRAQTKILRQMAQHINTGRLKSQESLILAQLFQDVADQLSQSNPAKELLDNIASFYEQFRQRPLPKTRQEFETRAILFQLLHDLEGFIQLKVDFYQDYQESTEE